MGLSLALKLKRALNRLLIQHRLIQFIYLIKFLKADPKIK
jgi:hypothetical protein